MSETTREYDEFLREVARFRGYPFPKRLDAWRRRLRISDSALNAIFQADEIAAASFLSPPPVPGLAAPADGKFAFPRTAADAANCSAGELAARVNDGEATPTEVAAAYLDRIDARPDLNAFVTVDRDRVMRDVESLAARLRSGARLPLAGVPVAVKDTIRVRGYPMTCGSRAWDASVSTEDAVAVARLRAAGAIVVGTSNLDELGYAATGLQAPFGRIVNPRSPKRIAGGSSSGSAAAVSAGFALIALGTDTGGALRLPASCCGVVGLKATHGAVSNEGVITRSWSLDDVGPMTRSVADCALAFEVLAGHEPGSLLGAGGRSAGFRLGRDRGYFFEGLHPAVAAAMERALGRLHDAGSTVTDVEIESIDLAPAAHFMTVTPEAAQTHWHLLTTRGEALGEDVRARLESGQFILAIDYIKAQRLRQHIRESVLRAMTGVDVLVMPTVTIPPPEIDERSISISGEASALLGRLTCLYNLTGLPAITIPCGCTDDGGPIGLQLAARPGDERTLLRAAHHCERLLAA